MKDDSNSFKELASLVVQKLSNYLKESQAGNGLVLKQLPANDLAKKLNLESIIENGLSDTKATENFVDTYLDNSQHMHHPNYIGHQVSVPHPSASIADLIHGLINNPMAIYEMGPSAAVIEKTVVHWMLKKIGWFKGDSICDFDIEKAKGGGVLTHGGSLANLTALVAARSKASPEAWVEGNPKDLVVLAPASAHYCISRSLSIMGMGERSLVALEVNALDQLKVDAIESVIIEQVNKGKKIMCLVANACITSTGLYDAIDQIADLCNKYNIWFHVDAAHGASALLSDDHKHFLKGIEKADSMIWDTHKMLRTSTLCAAVLFKDHQNMDRAFKQKGSYIFHEKESPGFDLISNTVECTKAGLGTKLFWSLAAEGEKGLANFVKNQYNKSKEFYKYINDQEDFSCLNVPEANIICFEYLSDNKGDDLQLKIRNKIVLRGKFYITSAEVNNKRYLRLSIMNPLTQLRHIEDLLNEIRFIASS